MAKILEGKKLAQQKLAELKQRIAASSTKPGLAIILVGDDAASKLYVALKEKAAKKIGIVVTKKHFLSTAITADVTQAIKKLNADATINGLIVQLPLPPTLDTTAVISAIDPTKDVDGFHPTNIAGYQAGDDRLMPLLISVIDQLLRETGSVEGKTAAIIAKESVFSQGLTHYFLSRQAAAVRTELGQPQLKTADIIIVALGQPHVLTGDMIKPRAVVIDIGITKKDGKTLGDADASIKAIAGWMTPVPGGVGPLTVATLLERTTNNALHG